MAIHIDGDGNFYFGASGTVDFDNITYVPDFSVTKDGVIRAVSGQIGGWELGSDYLRAENSSNQYIYLNADGTIAGNFVSGNSGWKISADGDAEFNSITIRLPSRSTTPTGGGNDVISLGNSFIYNNTTTGLNLISATNYVSIQDQLAINASGSSSNPSLYLEQAYNPSGGTDAGFYVENDFVGSKSSLYLTNGLNNILHTESNDSYLHIDASNISVYGGVGSNGEVLGKTANGLEWVTAGGTHPDSDHTSFANSSHTHTESDITNIGSHSHSYDNYSYWNLNLNGSAQIQSGNTVTFSSGTNTTAVRNGTTIRYDVSFPSLSIANTTSNNAAYAFVTAVSGHQITRTNTSSSTLAADGWRVNSSGGYVGAPGVGAHVWYTNLSSTSDETVKTGITDLTYGLDWINELTPISYRFQTRTVYVCENGLGPTEYSNSDDICGHCESQNEIDLAFYNEQLDEFNNGNLEEEPTHPTPLTTGLIPKEVSWGNSKENWGFSAQAIESSLPPNPDLQIVEDVERPDSGTMKVLEYTQMIAPLVKAVQELSTQISDLTARVEALEG